MCLGICGDWLLRSFNSVVAGLMKTSMLGASAGAVLFTTARPHPRARKPDRGGCAHAWKGPLPLYSHPLVGVMRTSCWLTQPFANPSIFLGWMETCSFWILPYTSSEVRVCRRLPALFLLPSFCFLWSYHSGRSEGKPSQRLSISVHYSIIWSTQHLDFQI